MKAARSVPGFLWWIAARRRRIDAARLLELADLGVPEWEEELYELLVRVERRGFPGLLRPLCDCLVQLALDERQTAFLEVGCGPMEATRQVMERLANEGNAVPRVFVGLDRSPRAWEAIRRNFASADAQLLEIAAESFDLGTLRRLAADSGQTQVVFVRADIAAPPAGLRAFDVSFSCKLRHHVRLEDRHRFDAWLSSVATVSVEYDDYRGPLTWLGPSVVAWRHPVLLNGAILSQVRQPTKSEALTMVGQRTRLHNPPGSYLRVVRSTHV